MQSEIDAIRTLLGSKPRPVGWSQRRRRLDEVGSVWPVASDVTLQTVDCDGVDGEWSLVPGSDPSRVLIYFHGGGYCSGSDTQPPPASDGSGPRGRYAYLGHRLSASAESPYPAAHEDAMTAWHFLCKQGIAANNIVVAGDSAGGNLAITLVNRLRDAGEPLPACAWVISPWTDLTMSGATLAPRMPSTRSSTRLTCTSSQMHMRQPRSTAKML